MEKYIGIENELLTFKGSQQVDFTPYFEKFTDSSDYKKSSKAIRTTTGNGFYVDGAELEILTPPIRLNKGFASRLTDSLMIGRDRVMKNTPSLKHTGYSMHWNLTFSGVSTANFYHGVAVPFQLFGLTPLSGSFNVREKTGRYEVLGDSLNSEDQIKATALLLGAYSYAIDHDQTAPILPVQSVTTGKKLSLFVPDGRYSTIDVVLPKQGFSGKMQAQQYLELFYRWVTPFVQKLGTSEEIINLQDFVFNKKKLEFDQFRYFAALQSCEGKQGGSYLPVDVALGEGPMLKHSGKKRDLPLEARLLGELVKQKNDNLDIEDWDKIIHNGKVVREITEIFNYANSLAPQLPKIKDIDLSHVKPPKIKPIKKQSLIEYDEKKDVLCRPEGPSLLSYVAEDLKRKMTKKHMLPLVWATAFALIGTAAFYPLARDMYINRSARKTIEQYESHKKEISNKLEQPKNPANVTISGGRK